MKLGELTKIIATIGPATFSEEKITELVRSGADLFRLNLSHGTIAEHAELIKRIRNAGKSSGREVGIILDLPGAKLRIGDVGRLTLTKNHKVALLLRGKAPANMITLRAPAPLFKAMEKGSVVAIDDGKILLRINRVEPGIALAEVVAGGRVESHKGITVLGTDLPLTEADNDKALALAKEADFIGVSFVKTAADVLRIRNKVRAILHNAKNPPKLVAKIETLAAVKNLDEIIKVSDAIMVARGDLGLVADPGSLPVFQKEIVKKSHAAGKPVIVATQMLDSMTTKPLPTRAEILDIANAVIDHVDAVMLSGETASGSWPKESVKVMSQVAAGVEKSSLNDLPWQGADMSPTDLFVHTLVDFIKNKGVKIVVNENCDLEMAALISRHRLEVRQVIPCKDSKLARQLTLMWGAYPVVGEWQKNLKTKNRVLVVGKDKTGFYARIEKI